MFRTESFASLQVCTFKHQKFWVIFILLALRWLCPSRKDLELLVNNWLSEKQLLEIMDYFDAL